MSPLWGQVLLLFLIDGKQGWAAVKSIESMKRSVKQNSNVSKEVKLFERIVRIIRMIENIGPQSKTKVIKALTEQSARRIFVSNLKLASCMRKKATKLCTNCICNFYNCHKYMYVFIFFSIRSCEYNGPILQYIYYTQGLLYEKTL